MSNHEHHPHPSNGPDDDQTDPQDERRRHKRHEPDGEQWPTTGCVQPDHAATSDNATADGYEPKHLDNAGADEHDGTEPNQTAELQPSIGLDPEHRPRGPSIWVVDEPGSHLGRWEPATGTAEQVRARIGNGTVDDVMGFGTFSFQRGDDPAMIAAVANGIAKHGEAFAAWAELHDGDLGMLASFEDAYLGEYSTAMDWAIQATGAQHILNELQMEVGELIAFFHFDAQAFVKDAVHTGQIWVERPDEKRCWVFKVG